MTTVLRVAPLQVLTIDLENRPLNYLGNDWTGAEITAMAWATDPELVWTLLLQPDGRYHRLAPDGDVVVFDPDEAVRVFRDAVAEADVVTGHYIRKHDLPILNAACMELGVPTLPAVRVSDTKEDLVKRKDLSASQENLSAMFRLRNPKHHMSQSEWREANRLTPPGIEGSRTRVVSDVRQHMEMRAHMLKRRLLAPPRMWRPFR